MSQIEIKSQSKTQKISKSKVFIMTAQKNQKFK